MSDVDTRPLRRTGWTAKDLLATDFPEPRWAVDTLIPEGLAVFAGAPKLGKSWLALGLSIAVASGGRAFGKIPTERGDVLYLALEDSPRRLKGRLSSLLHDEAPPHGLQIFTEWRRLGDGGAEAIAAWLVRNPETRLVVIDVYTRIRPRETRRTDFYAADYDAASGLQVVAMEHGIAILGLYHTRKAEAEDFVETVQGTFGTAAAADTILVARRGRGQADATIQVTGRDVTEQNLALSFAPEVGTWTLLGDALEYTLGETRREILEAIRTAGEAMSPKQLAEDFDIDHGLVKKTVQRMAKDGQLKVVKRGWYEVPVNPLSLPSLSPQGRDRGTERTGIQRETRVWGEP